MTLVAAKTASRYVDDEVVQRLLKAMDFTVFFATAMFYTATFASRPDAPNGTSIIAFFSLALTFLCLLLLRNLGLYKASALVNGGWTFLKSAAAVNIAGVAAYKSFDYFLKRFGLSLAGTIEPKPGIEPSPTHINALIPRAKSEGVKLVIIEPNRRRSTPEYLAKAIGAKLMVLPALVGGNDQAKDYLQLFDYNVRQLTGAR